MKKQVLIMLELQNAMNSKIHPEWVTQNFAWYRAIWVECAELMDHYGWKWWKHQEPDIEQVRLELVDIWHFGLSDMLQTGASPEIIADKVVSVLESSVNTLGLHEAVEAFTETTLASKSFDVSAFLPVLIAVDFSFDELYRQYIGKNVLNFFRQDHGYKEGSYQKIWGGREDNEHLVEILQSLDVASESFKDDVYEALKGRYPEVV